MAREESEYFVLLDTGNDRLTHTPAGTKNIYIYCILRPNCLKFHLNRKKRVGKTSEQQRQTKPPTVSGGTPAAFISPNSEIAACQLPPFPTAVMAVLSVTRSGLSPACRISSSRSGTCAHLPPLSKTTSYQHRVKTKYIHIRKSF